MDSLLSESCNVAVRVIHGQVLEDPQSSSSNGKGTDTTAPTASALSSSYLIDRVPDTVPLWDPFDYSSLAQSHLLLTRLSVAKTLFVAEGGYSQLDEAGTLSPRPDVQGDDALGWYLFGSVEGAGFVDLMAERSCAGGGNCWFSLVALDTKEAVDLVAPFFPTGGATTSRHLIDVASIMITSRKQLSDFLTTKVLTSPSFRKKRKHLSFLMIMSNTLNEYATILVCAEKHHNTFMDLVFPRANTPREPLPPVGGDLRAKRHPAEYLTAIVDANAERFSAAQQKGGLASHLTQPLLLTRVVRSQRLDPLDVMHLLSRTVAVSSTNPIRSKRSKSSVTATAKPPTPPPQPQLLSNAEIFGLTQDIRDMQDLHNQLSVYQHNIADVESDIREVLRATESIISENRSVQDHIALSTEEHETCKRAAVLLADHNKQMEVDISKLKAQSVALREAIASQEKKMTKSAADVEQAKLSGDADVRELDNAHHLHLERLRNEHNAEVARIRSEFAMQISDFKKLRTREMDDARRSIQHVDDNLALCSNNHRTVEQTLAQRQGEERSLQQAIQNVEERNAQLESTLGTITTKHTALKALQQTCRDQKRKLELVDDSILQFQMEVDSVTQRNQQLRTQLREEQRRRHEAQDTFTALQERALAMRRSSFFAKEQSGRSVVAALADAAWAQVQRDYSALRKVAQHRLLSLTAERATMEIYDSITAAQQQESELQREKSELESNIRDINAELELTIKNQERELASLSDECTSTVRRIDDLRVLQQAKFVERERDLAALRTSYKHLFQEFMMQIEQESSIAIAARESMKKPPLGRTAAAAAENQRPLRHQSADVSNRMMGGGSTVTSRGPSVATTTSGTTITHLDAAASAHPPLTAGSLATHIKAQSQDDMSLWDTCVHMYLQWSNEVSKQREVDQETTRVQHRIARTEAAALSVAESIALERQRLADVEAELAKCLTVGTEAKDALREFVRNASEQRKDMERAIQGILADEQDRFKQLGAEVEDMHKRIATLKSSLSEVDGKCTVVVREVDDFKSSGVDQLKVLLLQHTEVTADIENALTSLRQRQRSALGLSRDFYSMEEQSLRAMGLSSMRDEEKMFEPQLHTEATEPSSRPSIRTTAIYGAPLLEAQSGQSAATLSASAAATIAESDDRWRKATLEESSSFRRTASSSVTSAAVATLADTATSRPTSRPTTPVSSVFYFASSSLPPTSGTPSLR